MFKKTFIALTLPLLFLLVMAASPPEADRGALGSSSTAARRHPSQADATSAPGTGTLQKMIVENGGVTMDFDLNGLNGSSSLVARPITLQFAVGANSFFPILVFNDLLRGPEPGSMTLVPSSPDKSWSAREITQTKSRADHLTDVSPAMAVCWEVSWGGPADVTQADAY